MKYWRDNDQWEVILKWWKKDDVVGNEANVDDNDMTNDNDKCNDDDQWPEGNDQMMMREATSDGRNINWPMTWKLILWSDDDQSINDIQWPMKAVFSIPSNQMMTLTMMTPVTSIFDSMMFSDIDDAIVTVLTVSIVCPIWLTWWLTGVMTDGYWRYWPNDPVFWLMTVKTNQLMIMMTCPNDDQPFQYLLCEMMMLNVNDNQ